MQIKLENIGKKYYQNWLFRSLHFDFSPQNTHVIFGPPGSGKSTFLQLMAGFISPSEGNITYFDAAQKMMDPTLIFKEVAFCSPFLRLWEELNAKEVLKIHSRFKKMTKSAEEIFEALDFSTKIQEKPLEQLSSGMQQRFKLALAIFSETSLLFLDEPCAHLDAAWMLWYQEKLTEKLNDTPKILCFIASNRIEKEYAFLRNQNTYNFLEKC